MYVFIGFTPDGFEVRFKGTWQSATAAVLALAATIMTLAASSAVQQIIRYLTAP